MIELPEPSAHMYPSDLERFQETETFAHAYSVKVGCPDETSTELYTADQLRTCIKKAAAEAREQMREECVKLFNEISKAAWAKWLVECDPHQRGVSMGANACEKVIKELK